MVVLVSCREKEEPPVVEPMQITMTTAKAELKISLGGVDTAVIDFGDGSTDTVTFDGHKWINITHRYSDETERTITITGYVAGLNCEDNRLTALDVSGNPALESLYCSKNLLTGLNLDQLSGLINLGCNENQLTRLDVSKLTRLERLYCRQNQLTSLNVVGLTKLHVLSCSFNYMDAAALNGLFQSLSAVASGELYAQSNGPDYDGSGSEGCDAGIAEQKGWEVVLK
jgi:hypothetical protein